MALKIVRVEKGNTLWEILQEHGQDPQLYRELFLLNAYEIAAGITEEFAKTMKIPVGIEIVVPVDDFQPSGM